MYIVLRSACVCVCTQDPESVDVLQDTGFKKDGGSGSESGSVSKSRRPKTESNFVSFVTDPDSEMPEKTK